MRLKTDDGKTFCVMYKILVKNVIIESWAFFVGEQENTHN